MVRRVGFFVGICCWLALGALRGAGVVNGGFESGDLTGWTPLVCTATAATEYSSGTYYSFGSPTTMVLSGPATAYLVQDLATLAYGPLPSGASYYTGGAVSEFHAGAFGLELSSGFGAGLHGDYAGVSQDIVVPAGASYLQYWFSALLSTAHAGQGAMENAYVEARVDLVGGSRLFTQDYEYNLVGDGPTVPGIQGGWRYLPWNKVCVDLSGYQGQTVRVEFAAYDCSPSGHGSFAYVDDVAMVPSCVGGATPLPTFTSTFGPTSTATPDASPSSSPTTTPSPTCTASLSPSDTATASPTFTASPTPTITRTFTPSFTITPTFTETPLPLLLTPHHPSPNPGGPDAIFLPYTLSVPAKVFIKVYDVSGELVRRLDVGFRLQGNHEERWDLRNDGGAGVASGVYLCRIEAQSQRGELADVFEKCAVLR